MPLTKRTNPYNVKRIGGKIYYEHRLIWAEANGPIPDGYVIHHINGNKKDNRLANLAMVTAKENRQKYDVIGKGWKKNHNNYAAMRYINGVQLYLGTYKTKCGAIMASRLAYITTGT